MNTPFLRWVGGKNDQLEDLLLRAPHRASPYRYLEAFVGGGALFFKLRSLGLVSRAVLADSNERLVRCYRAVRDAPGRVADLVERWPVHRDWYFRVRDWQVDAGDDVEVAAWVVYVNHAGYGGMYRVSAQGRFNTSYDEAHDGQPWAGRERLHAASVALRGVDVVAGDFADVLAAHARRGWFSYFDPPYLTTSSAEFANGYSRRGFGRRDHERLAQAAALARANGVGVLASNSSAAAPIWKAQGFRVELLEGRRMIGRKFEGAAPRAAEMIAVG